jgi:thiamine pyrophosphokinase
MDSIAIPALGAGGGRLDATVVASVLLPIANNVQHDIEVRFVDQNEDFINAINKQLR